MSVIYAVPSGSVVVAAIGHLTLGHGRKRLVGDAVVAVVAMLLQVFRDGGPFQGRATDDGRSLVVMAMGGTRPTIVGCSRGSEVDARHGGAGGHPVASSGVVGSGVGRGRRLWMGQGHAVVGSDRVGVLAYSGVPVGRLMMPSDGVPTCPRVSVRSRVPVGWVIVCRDMGWSLVGFLELLEDCRDGRLQTLGSHGPLMLFHQFVLLGLDGLKPSALLKGAPASSPSSLFEATKDVEGNKAKAHEPGDDQDGCFTISLPIWFPHFGNVGLTDWMKEDGFPPPEFSLPFSQCVVGNVLSSRLVNPHAQ